MRKILIMTTCLLLIACSGQGNTQNNEKGNGDSVQNLMDNEETNVQGGPKTIKVKGGGEAPDVMTLLKAFQEAMPTNSVELVLKHGEKLADGT